MEDLSVLVHNVKKISSLPTVFLKINEVINDPCSSAADLGKVIEKDQALTTRLLRLANSAFYGLPGKVDTVSRAVALIGFKQLQELVLAMSVRSLFTGFGQNSAINMRSFWAHSIACGIACKTLAILRGMRSPESFFVAGFLHDFGRLIMLEQFPQQCSEIYEAAREQGRLLYEVEQEVFGFTHADVGGELVNCWRMPGVLAEAIKYHHRPEGAREFPLLAAMVHIANILAHAGHFGMSGDHLVPPMSTDAWKSASLKVSMLEPAMNKTHEQFQDLYDSLMQG